jgi:hypothetical protein
LQHRISHRDRQNNRLRVVPKPEGKIIMKKKIFVALLASSILATGSSTFTVNATTETEISTDSSSESSTISFRNIPWWTSKNEVEKILVADGASIEQAAFEDNILRMSGIDFANSTSGKDRVDGGGTVARYSGIKVAGYTPSETQACYIYNLNDDGTINKDKETAQFYFGWYTFEARDYVDGEGVYNDLAQKLQSLYGEGIVNDESSYYTTITWIDADNNQIRLLLGGKDSDTKYVTLGYMAAGADERLNEMQISVDAEAVQQEAAERKKNKEDISGL